MTSWADIEDAFELRDAREWGAILRLTRSQLSRSPRQEQLFHLNTGRRAPQLQWFAKPTTDSECG